jgi:hypothetical protein
VLKAGADMDFPPYHSPIYKSNKTPMKTTFQQTKELYPIDPMNAYNQYLNDPTGIKASYETFCSEMNRITAPPVKNLLNTLPEKFEKIIDDFGISEVFIDEFQEVHITSNYELHPSWAEAIIKYILR